MTVEIIKATPIGTRSEIAKKFRGKAPCADDFDRVVDDDADIYDENGEVIIRFRKNVLPKGLSAAADGCWGDMDTKEPASTTRNSAAGELNLEKLQSLHSDVVDFEKIGTGRGHLILSDGTKLKSMVSNPVFSYLAGFGVARFTNLAVQNRLTKHFPTEWRDSIPFFQAISRFHALMVPEIHALHLERIKLHPQWVIPGAALSTVTLNINYESAYHYDVGDFKKGFSTLTVVERGDYRGGQLVLPQFRIALDVRTGDIGVKRSHIHLHGNLPLDGRTDGAKRISFVTYLKHRLANAPNRLDQPDEHNNGWHHGKQVLKPTRDIMSKILKARR